MRSRTRLLGMPVIACAVAVVIGGCGSSSSGGGSSSSASAGGAAASTGSSKAPITFDTWGGAYQQAQQKSFIPAFEQQTGIHVNVTNPIDYAKLKAMVVSHNVIWDVADVEPYVAYQDCKNGLLQKLDFNVIKNDFLPEMPATACSVPNGAFGLAIAYRSDKFSTSNHPMSWADFFNVKKFPGKRAVPNYAESGLMEAAELAAGVPKSKLYPINYQLAFKKLSSIRSDLVFWESGDQAEQLMESGEVDMSACSPTRMYDAHATQGTPISIVWNDALYGYDVDVIPKGAPHVAEGMKFIAFLTQPSQEIAMTKYVPWGPSTPQAAAHPDPATASWIPTSPQHRAVGIPINYGYWGPASPKADALFANWLLQ